MTPSRTPGGPIVPAVLLAFLLVAVLAAAAFAGASPGTPDRPVPSGGPGATPSATPSATPTPVPLVTPTPAPTVEPSGLFVVDLDTATTHDVSVVVDDRIGVVQDATSGRAGDGMSVRWFDVEVVNVDASTLRVTWVGLPRDEQVALTIGKRDKRVTLAFEQAAPPANSDAVGFDRVLVLTFGTNIDAADVAVTFAEAD